VPAETRSNRASSHPEKRVHDSVDEASIAGGTCSHHHAPNPVVTTQCTLSAVVPSSPPVLFTIQPPAA
jgi:hypothetical protein